MSEVLRDFVVSLSLKADANWRCQLPCVNIVSFALGCLRVGLSMRGISMRGRRVLVSSHNSRRVELDTAGADALRRGVTFGAMRLFCPFRREASPVSSRIPPQMG